MSFSKQARGREQRTRSIPRSSAVFRIGFGLVGLLLVLRFFVKGWVGSLYIEPAYHFPYPGFEWVAAWPGWGMYAHFALLGLAALGILLGYRTRFCAAAFAVLLTYVELIDRSLYLNHYYWVILTAAVLAVLPVSRAYAIEPHGDRPAPEQRWIPVVGRVAAPVSGRDGLLFRRTVQDQFGLAGARRAAGDVAPFPGRPSRWSGRCWQFRQQPS